MLSPLLEKHGQRERGRVPGRVLRAGIASLSEPLLAPGSGHVFQAEWKEHLLFEQQLRGEEWLGRVALCQQTGGVR